MSKKYTLSALLGLFLFFVTACSNSNSNKDEQIQNSTENESEARLVPINNRLFSVPSPMQVSLFMKEKKIAYNKDLLNDVSNVKNYTTNFKQALSLGVYGADLGYLHIQEQFPEAGKYFSTIEELVKKLGINTFINEGILKRVEKNQSNKDSMLQITSKMFLEADAFLLDNSRNEIAVLVLTGGWIESLHFITQSTKASDKDLTQRIAEQKHPLDNLIDLLRPYYGKQSEDFDKLLEELVELATIFDSIDIKYAYEKPTTIADQKMTVINSKSEANITDVQLKNITEKIATIRKMIVQ